MRIKVVFLMVCTSVFFYVCMTAFVPYSSGNNPPEVKITNPVHNSRFEWNALVNYKITVIDKEDGSSEYSEIPTKEVLLKVVYLPTSAKAESYLTAKSSNTDIESPGLLFITKSGCFNCHAVKNKLIGPSFEQIAKRYGNNPTSVKMLTKKVIQGSTGVWGNIAMPPHPDLKAEQTTEILIWILKNSTNPDVNYLAGLEGGFRTKPSADKNAGNKGVYILTATYSDHGLQDMPQLSKRGQHSIILKN